MNPQNRFVEELLFNIKRNNVRALFVCSDPDTHEFTDACAASMRKGLEEIGIQFDAFNVLDGRNPDWTRQFVDNSEVIILAGGHVPTQNKFLKQIHLRENLKHFRGVVIGISAGSMNLAETVYVQPEEEGESSPDFERSAPGLGLTDVNILPHYQKVKDNILDGKRLFEDVTYADSYGQMFFVLPDGSYFFQDDDGLYLYGESYIIHDGEIDPIQGDDECLDMDEWDAE